MKSKIKAALDQLRSAPLKVKIVVLLAVIYLASPIDLIPDFIPVLGQLDDLIIIAAVTKYVTKHVPAFKL